MTPQAEKQLRASLLKAAQENFDDGDNITDTQDWRRFLDDAVEAVSTHLQSIRQAIEATWPEKLDYPEPRNPEKVDNAAFNSNIGGFNKALAQCQAALAKGFETAAPDTPQGKEDQCQ